MPDIAGTILALRFSGLPNAVVEQARGLLLDLIGVAASGRRTLLAEIAADHAVRHFGAGEGVGCRLLFDGRRASMVGAAFAGAAAIDSFDAHDGHALTKGHAGVAVLPALLAAYDGDPEADDRAFLAISRFGSGEAGLLPRTLDLLLAPLSSPSPGTSP